MLIEKSENFAKVCAALAKAQSGFAEIERNSVGQDGNRRFSYADFAAIRSAVIGPLTENELALFSGYATRRDGDQVVVSVQTELVHSSGEYLRTPVVEHVLGLEDSPKRIGAVSTYHRRYQARTLLGIADEEADGEGERAETARAAPPPAAAPANGARFQCQHGHKHTSAQAAKECKDEGGGAPERTLEPGEDPPAMKLDLAAVARNAIAAKDWKAVVATIGKIPEGPVRKELAALYESSRYPKQPTA